MRMNAIWYPVAKWEEAKRFYGEILGLRQTHCSDELGWVAYNVGPVPFFLVRNADRAGVPGGGAITLEHEDIDGIYRLLRDAGVRVEETTRETDSVRNLTLFDQDGNMLEISGKAG